MKNFEENVKQVQELLGAVSVLAFYSENKKLLAVYYTIPGYKYDKLKDNEMLFALFHTILEVDAENLFGRSRFVFTEAMEDKILQSVYIRVRVKRKAGAKEEIPSAWRILNRKFDYGEMFYL